ncbi:MULTISPECIES: hypothetical protein [unclassified Thioalkalivibrio]|uniref:hypothetical protein n=1 Tax=unclassified Thioalkalivibrio TaxID=2621013 RepID=UPI00037F8C59|nr:MULTISPECIES: hypothetical protein [unclassified Thioalkalivibrio]
MAIFEPDIQLLEADRLTDDDDGGGRLTGNVIESGQANNLFPDISSLDRVYGRVSLRKAYPAVRSPNTDVYYGAHLAIVEPPEDPTVHVALFDTQNWTDRRLDAQDRIESYVVLGPEARAYLLGTQFAGQRQITVLQRLDAPIPEIGTTLALDDESGAQRTTQYIRVTDIDHQEVEYEDDRGTYIRRRVTMEISEPLRSDFPGYQPSRTRVTGGDTTVRETVVADAARYYGITPLREPAQQGDLTVDCARIFTPLVPATQAETPLTDEDAAAGVPITLETDGGDVEFQDVAQTDAVEVTLQNRAFNYVYSATPRPAPGTVSVNYRAQGRWYELRDDGEGRLEGTGTGTVDYTTGTIQATLAELPDVPSAIMYAWGAGELVYHDRSGTEGDLDDTRIRVEAGKALLPGSVTVSWLVGGDTKTATDDGKGQLSGDASGAIYYPTGLAILEPSASEAPDFDSLVQVEGDEAPSEALETSPSLDSNGVAVIELGEGIMPGSLSLEYQVEWSEERARYGGRHVWGLSSEVDTSSRTGTRTRRVQDDGEGGLRGATGNVDYSTGTITVTVVKNEEWSSISRENWASGVVMRGEERVTQERLASGIAVRYFPPGVTGSTVTEQVEAPAVEGNLLGLRAEQIIPGSLRFRWRGSTYEDRDGDLVIDPDPSTGFGVTAGSVRYDTGEIELTRWGSGSQALEVLRMATATGTIATNRLAFRVPGAPLRNQSLIVNALTAQGDSLTIQGNANGELSDPSGRTRGKVDWETGAVDLEFGLWVGENWQYSEDDSDPDAEPHTLVIPGDARFSAVVFSSIPLDPDILGLDPIRLPADGRVPFIRSGNVAIIHHTDTTDLGNGDTTTDLGRERLSYAHVYDAEGERVPDEQLEIDLDAGTVRVDDPSGYSAPFYCEHRIEDMRLVSEAQITGVVSLASPLSHDFPGGETYLSTALLYGDLQAAAGVAWDQQTWTGTWADERIGDAAGGTYNQTDYPIEVTNEGAIEERWRLEFNTTSTVNVIGEYTGQILTNVPIDEEIAPTNPTTEGGVPYFRIDPDGWGGGWSTGNVVRFDTRAANRPVWIARTVLASDDRTESDAFRLQTRGDAS